MANSRRIWHQVDKNHAVRSPHVLTADNRRVIVATTPITLPLSSLPDGAVLEQMPANGYQNGNGLNGSFPSHVVNAVDNGGSLQKTNVRVPSIEALAGISRNWSFKIVNPSGNGTQTIVVGDKSGLVTLYKGYTAPTGLTITGNFGANTVSKITDITGDIDVLVRGLHTEVSNADVYASGSVSQIEASLDGKSAVERPINFQKLYHSSDYVATVREVKDYNQILNANNGLVIVLPEDRNITVTMDIVEAAKARLMGVIE